MCFFVFGGFGMHSFWPALQGKFPPAPACGASSRLAVRQLDVAAARAKRAGLHWQCEASPLARPVGRGAWNGGHFHGPDDASSSPRARATTRGGSQARRALPRPAGLCGIRHHVHHRDPQPQPQPPTRAQIHGALCHASGPSSGREPFLVDCAAAGRSDPDFLALPHAMVDGGGDPCAREKKLRENRRHFTVRGRLDLRPGQQCTRQ